jgi:alpha-ketoglutarate-dependent taurine dioxygenase
MDRAKRIANLPAEKLDLLLQRISANGEVVPAAPLRAQSRHSTRFPLSHAQQRLWFLDQLHPGATTYNELVAARCIGRLDAQAFEHSLNEVVRRHEILRTTFTTSQGNPVQVVLASLNIALTLVDLTHTPPADRERQFDRLTADLAQAPFDLARGPLLRAQLVRFDDNEHVLLLAMHHIVADSWSMAILIRELTSLYVAKTQGQAPDLAELPMQYADYTVWQREWLSGEAIAGHLAYWKRHLAHPWPVLELPTDRPRRQLFNSRGAREPLVISKALSDALVRLSQQEGVTLYMLLLAAFQTLLYRLSGQDDIIVGTTTGHRAREEHEHLIGFFVNTMALRADLSGNPSFRELLERVQQLTQNAYAHQDLPFEKLIEELPLSPAQRLSDAPLFRVMFTFLTNPIDLTIQLPGLAIQTMELDPQTAKRELTLRIMKQPGQGLVGLFEYGTDLFDASTIRRWARRFEILLSGIVAQPDTKLKQLEILSSAEKQETIMEDREREASSHKKMKKFLSVKPQAMTLSQADLVKSYSLRPEWRFPLVMEPRVEGLDLISWAQEHRESLENTLIQHGAILFRNFDIHSPAVFEQLAKTVDPRLMDYDERSTPRSSVSGKVLTSTEYPADQYIMLHNEMAYAYKWPAKIWFFCAQPAAEGGETPLADSQQVFEALGPAITTPFLEKNVMYVRNYGEELDLPWQEVFQTSERTEVEQYCRAHGIAFEWKSDNGLRTRQVRQAAIRHPVTGALVWFNSAHMFHISSLDTAVQQSLQELFAEEDLPRNAYYGDGSPIDPAVIAEIRRVYLDRAIAFPWQAGDILMVDNILVSHGRGPFVGPRKVLVTMAG